MELNHAVEEQDNDIELNNEDINETDSEEEFNNEDNEDVELYQVITLLDSINENVDDDNNNLKNLETILSYVKHLININYGVDDSDDSDDSEEEEDSEEEDSEEEDSEEEENVNGGINIYKDDPTRKLIEQKRQHEIDFFNELQKTAYLREMNDRFMR